MDYLNFILTILTIVTCVLTILTFANGKNKDSKTTGLQVGAMSQKIDDIDKRTEKIYLDVSGIRNANTEIGKNLASVQADVKAAHKRIDTLEVRLQKVIDRQ